MTRAMEDRVKPPAIGLMVTAGIVVALALASLACNVLGAGIGVMGASSGDEQIANAFSGTIGIISAVVSLAIYGFILFGAWKMMNMESWGLSMGAAIAACVPCSLCCILTLPMGIWALVVLNDQNVKAAFRS